MSKTNHILSVVTDGPATRPTDRLTAGGKAKSAGRLPALMPLNRLCR